MPDPVTPDPELREAKLIERGYLQGARAARVAMLRQLFDQLGYDTPTMPTAAWILEREGAIAQLRILCGRIGDLDWGDQLHLADIIDKHLGQHLGAPLSREDLEAGFRRVMTQHAGCECAIGDLVEVVLGKLPPRSASERRKEQRARVMAVLDKLTAGTDAPCYDDACCDELIDAALGPPPWVEKLAAAYKLTEEIPLKVGPVRDLCDLVEKIIEVHGR